MVYAVQNDGELVLPQLAQLSVGKGFFRGAYPGLSASLLRQMTCGYFLISQVPVESPLLDSLTRFGVYEAAKQRLKSPGEKALPAYKMVCGSI